MAIKYKTYFEEISKVEIDRETETSVWLKDHKHSVRKINSYESYHNTFKEAKEHLIQIQLKEIARIESSINYYQDKLLKIEKIKEF